MLHKLELTDDELFALNVLVQCQPNVRLNGEDAVASQRRFEFGLVAAKWKVMELVASVEKRPEEPKTFAEQFKQHADRSLEPNRPGEVVEVADETASIKPRIGHGQYGQNRPAEAYDPNISEK